MKLLRSPWSLFSYLFIFLLFFIPPLDTDLGWHLRYGEFFIKSGQFLKTNTLTYYLPGYFWQNSYSLYQIIVYLINKFFGLLGLSLFNSIIFILAFYFFNRLNPKSPKLNFTVFVVILLFGWNVFNPGLRAQEFTFIFSIIIYYFLSKFDKIYNHIGIFILIPILFIFWVNLHGGFIIGIFLLGLSTFSYFLTKNFILGLRLLLLTLLSLIATFINPYYFSIYQETSKHLFYPLPRLIAEWVPPSIWYQSIMIIIAFIVIFSFASSKNKKRFFWILSVFSISYLSIKSRRNLPIFALTSAIAVYDLATSKLKLLEKNKIINNLGIGILLIVIPFTLITNVTKSVEFSTNWNVYCTQGMLPYPCKAVEFIKSNKIKGENVFSSYEWGGFLEWQLPDYKFFVDGRTPAWQTPEGKSPYTIYLEIIQAQPTYQEQLKKYETDWLLIGANTFLDLALSQNKNAPWEEVYRDNISVIYLLKQIK